VNLALSLVICTRNRADALSGCLDAVAEIRSSRPWEVVVVDNAPIDSTRVVHDLAAYPVAIRTIAEPVPGVARARNSGWRLAAGAIIAFTDDDCYPAPNLVDGILDRFEEDPGLGFLGGSVILHDPNDASVAVVAGQETVEIQPGGFVTPGCLISANLAFRREVLETIGGFDVAFGYDTAGFAGEDVDAVARASAAGWRGRYDPALVVRHHHGRGPGPDAEWTRRAYDIGRGAFFAKSALDPRMRRTYLAGWLRLTLARFKRRDDFRPVVRELWGAARYLWLRFGPEPGRSGS